MWGRRRCCPSTWTAAQIVEDDRAVRVNYRVQSVRSRSFTGLYRDKAHTSRKIPKIERERSGQGAGRYGKCSCRYRKDPPGAVRPKSFIRKRLELFKSLQAWPRIVLGLYRAELAIASKDRKEKGAPEYGSEKPSEIARYAVGEALGLGPDRVRDLCKEGHRHLKQGMPSREETITAAMFKQMLSMTLPENIAVAVRKSFSEEKEKIFPASRKSCALGSRLSDRITSFGGRSFRAGVVFLAEKRHPIKRQATCYRLDNRQLTSRRKCKCVSCRIQNYATERGSCGPGRTSIG